MIYLGIDCGTQSTKALALDGDSGAVLASGSKAHEMVADLHPGHVEQHPAGWLEAMDFAVRQVIEKFGARRDEVRGLGISGQQHGLVTLDADNQVIRPAKLWSDTSTTEECNLFRVHFGGATALVEETGLDMLPGYTAPKLLWMKRREPANFARIETVLLPHDYLNLYLTGKTRMEYGDASGTAMLNIRARKWSSAILKFIDAGLESKMPEVRSSREPAGPLRAELATHWGLPADVRVSAGGGDNMMAAIGTGNVAPGVVTASLGTSGTLFAYSAAPVIDPEGEVAGFCDSTDGWLPLVCTMNMAGAIDAVRQLFGWSLFRMEETIRKVPAGCDGLIFLPYLQGERTPNLPRGSGVYHGLDARTMTSAHMMRAALEGVTQGMAYGLARLRTLGVAPAEIRLTGGGSKSAFWRQLCADIFGCPVVTLIEPEGAALGAAIQALAAVQPEKSVNDWSTQLVRLNAPERIEPQADLAFDYAAALKKQTELTRTLAKGGFL